MLRSGKSLKHEIPALPKSQHKLIIEQSFNEYKFMISQQGMVTP